MFCPSPPPGAALICCLPSSGISQPGARQPRLQLLGGRPCSGKQAFGRLFRMARTTKVINRAVAMPVQASPCHDGQIVLCWCMAGRVVAGQVAMSVT